MNVKMSSSPKSESRETILIDWMVTCRHRKRLHDEASKYYKRYVDTCILSAIILGITAGILNIALAIEPISFVVVNIAQICLGTANLLASTAIVTASRQLE